MEGGNDTVFWKLNVSCDFLYYFLLVFSAAPVCEEQDQAEVVEAQHIAVPAHQNKLSIEHRKAGGS